MIGFLAKYKLYLILGGVFCALVAGNLLYIRSLQSSNQRLNNQNVELQSNLNAERQAREEDERRFNIQNQVTRQTDTIRQENRQRFDNQRQRINNRVQQGRDRPVGPLLEEFFNEER